MGWTNLVDDNGNVYGIVGDDGWDLATDFVESFQNLYIGMFGRTATIEEIFESINFVYDTSTENFE